MISSDIADLRRVKYEEIIRETEMYILGHTEGARKCKGFKKRSSRQTERFAIAIN